MLGYWQLPLALENLPMQSHHQGISVQFMEVELQSKVIKLQKPTRLLIFSRLVAPDCSAVQQLPELQLP